MNVAQNDRLIFDISFNKKTLSFTMEKNKNIIEVKPKIKNLFQIDSNTLIDILIGKFYLNDFLVTIPIGIILNVFLTNKMEIVISSQNIMNFNSIKNISYEIKNLKLKKLEFDFEKYKNILFNLIDVEESTKLNVKNIEKVHKDLDKKLKQVYSFQKNSITNLEDEDETLKEIRMKIDKEKEKCDQLEIDVEKNFEKIINYKFYEKEAVNIYKENRKLIGNIHSNVQLIEDIKETNIKLEKKKFIVIKKKELSNKMVKKIINVEKNVSIGKNNLIFFLADIKLKYLKLFQHNAIIELVNFRQVALYYPLAISDQNKLYNDGEIKLKIFDDKCDFGYFYNTQEKRELISLNLNDKLITILNKHIFTYDLQTNSMNFNGILDEYHKGGNLVYIPYDNLVYCISGILCSTVETINIFNDPDYDKKCSVTQLSQPRAYFGTFIQNESKIYVFLGYNYMKNDFMSTIEKLDTASHDKTWKELFFSNDNKIPKLVFISCIPSSLEKIHILGGVDENYLLNKLVYIVKIDQNGSDINECNMVLPFEDNNQKINLGRDNNKGYTSLFYQENCFIALKTPSEENSCYLFGIYDSKHNLHLANMNNFNYCILSRKEEKEKNIKNAYAINNLCSDTNTNNVFNDNESNLNIGNNILKSHMFNNTKIK